MVPSHTQGIMHQNVASNLYQAILFTSSATYPAGTHFAPQRWNLNFTEK